MRGPKTVCVLQKPEEGRTSGGGVTSDPWHPVTSFRAGLRQLSASEAAAYGTKAEISLYRLLIGRNEVREDVYRELKSKNRIYCENRENPMAPETFDIIGVIPFKRGRNRITGWRLILRKAE